MRLFQAKKIMVAMYLIILPSTINAQSDRYYGVPDNNGDGVADEKDYFDIPADVMKEMFPEPESYALNKASSISEAPQEYIDAMNHVFWQPNTNGDLLWYGSGDADSSGVVDWDDHTAMQQGIMNDMADVDGDGFPSTTSDQQILEDKLNGVIHYMPAYINSFQDFSERHSWNQNIWEIDQLDTTTWVYNEYVSGAFGKDTYFRHRGYFDPSDINIPDKYDMSMNARFNQPVYYVVVFDPSYVGHGMNMMFKNPEIIVNDSVSIDNCYFIEPQADGLDVQTGTWSIPFGTKIRIYGIEGFYDNGGAILYPIAGFQDNDNNGTFELDYQNSDLVLQRPVGIKEESQLPDDFELKQNFPNPFNPSTTIQYEIPEQSYVTLHIYDIVGRKVNTLVNSTQATGQYSIKWNGTDHDGQQVSTGVYFARLQAGSYSEVIKMVYLQ